MTSRETPPGLVGVLPALLIFSALGVATLGSLYLPLAPHGYPRAFAAVEHIQMGIATLLAASPRPAPTPP